MGFVISCRQRHCLVVQSDIDLLAVLGRLTAPDALVVLGQRRDVGEAGILDAALGLILGEAVCAWNGGGRVGLTGGRHGRGGGVGGRGRGGGGVGGCGRRRRVGRRWCCSGAVVSVVVAAGAVDVAALSPAMEAIFSTMSRCIFRVGRVSCANVFKRRVVAVLGITLEQLNGLHMRVALHMT